MFGVDFKRASHASVLLLFFMVIKSLLGLLLKRAMAGYFGAGIETDAYFAAFTVPQQLGDFVIGGIIFRLVIPVFQQRRQDVGDIDAKRDIAGILNFSFLVLLFLSLIYFFSIPFLVPYLFSGFDRKTMLLTITLSRWLAPSIILMGLSLIYTAFYHSYKSFLIPALSALVFPVSSIAALFLLPDKWGIMRLVYGNLLGVSTGLLVLVLFIGKKFKWSWNWNFSNPALKTTIMLAWPLFFSNLIGRIIPFVQKNAASRLPDQGNISLLEYAFFLSGSVLIFVVSPVTTTIFPLIGELKAKENHDEIKKTFYKALGVVLFLAFPCVLFLILASTDIVDLLLKNGKFSNENVIVCGKLIVIIAIMIIPQSIVLLMNNVFIIYKDTKIMSLFISILTLLAIPFYFLLSDHYYIYGIAMVYSGFYVLNCCGLGCLLFFRHKNIFSFAYLWMIFKYLLLGVSLFFIMKFYDSFQFLKGAFVPVRLLVFITLLSFVYLILSYLLKVNQLKFILSRFLKKTGDKDANL